jgi:hypothetical protein
MVAFRIAGYRRFEAETTLDLTPRVVAVVGPNEAGKSSLLTALEKLTRFEADEAFETAEFTGRRVPDGEKRVLSALFELESEDRDALEAVPGAVALRLWGLERRANGKAYAECIPRLMRDQTLRRKVATDVERTLANSSLDDYLNSQVPSTAGTGDEEPAGETEQRPTGREVLDAALEDLKGQGDSLSEAARERLEEMGRAIDRLPARAPKYARDLAARGRALAKEHGADHPNDVAHRILDARCPRVRVLRDDDRQLRTSYPFEEFDTPPAPLANLLFVAGLDWSDLKNAASEPANPQLRTMIEAGNRRLAETLQASWKQSEVSIELAEQSGALHIYPYDLDSATHSRIEDRSDGFKSFLALCTFTSRFAEANRRLVLAIDEAEMHLHYDAQADLVRVLTQQNLVPQIIYTTHSAGCLPEDLGSAIRVVRIIPGDRSAISNGFWSVQSEETGFTSLLMAMGAGAVAFTPTRRAVITEGPSDALLLPALLRAAMGRQADHPLGLQVAGGLAWTPPRRLGALEGEAAHVVYLVDSDGQGGKYREDLEAAGVDRRRIFILRAGNVGGLSIEDFVDKDTYVGVVNLLLRTLRGYEDDPLRVFDIPNRGAARASEDWTRSRGVEPVPKPAVAENLLRVSRASLAYSHWDPGDVAPKVLLRESRRPALIRLFRGLCDSLDLDPETGQLRSSA